MDPIVTAFGTFDWDTVDHIVTFADKNDLPPLSLLSLALQESSNTLDQPLLNLDAVGDSGTSFGIFQIHVPPHLFNRAHWSGLNGMDNAMEEMRSRWQDAFAEVGSWNAWLADPVGFMVAWAPKAQGSIDWSREVAGKRTGQGMVIYVQYLKALAASSAGNSTPTN